MLKVPETTPVAVGVKVTLTVQLAPAARGVTHVFVWAKFPVVPTVPIFSGIVVVLVMVNLIGLLVRTNLLSGERQRRLRERNAGGRALYEYGQRIGRIITDDADAAFERSDERRVGDVDGAGRCSGQAFAASIGLGEVADGDA